MQNQTNLSEDTFGYLVFTINTRVHHNQVFENSKWLPQTVLEKAYLEKAIRKSIIG